MTQLRILSERQTSVFEFERKHRHSKGLIESTNTIFCHEKELMFEHIDVRQMVFC